MYNNFERIESVQLKTELVLKLNNPFGVNKSLINFDYTNMIKFLKHPLLQLLQHHMGLQA